MSHTPVSSKSPMTATSIIVRKAKLSDVKAIHKLLTVWAGKGMLLPRPLSHLYTHVRDFYVICTTNEQAENRTETLRGCCALSIFWDDLAEIRSIAVDPDFLGQGFGRKLMDATIAEAKDLGLTRLFALTYQEAFFAHMEFSVVGKDELPHKVWTDCINCPKFPDCDEIAVQRLL